MSVFMGSLASLLLLYNVLLGAVFSAFFLSVLFFTKTRRDFILVAFFFILGVVSFQIYFNIDISNNVKIRVVDKKSYYFIGDYQGRKIILNGNIKGLIEGQKIEAWGSYKNERDYQKGITGSYYINKYSSCREDFIYSLYQMKRNMYMNFNSVLGLENSSILMALCFGDTSYLRSSQMNEFNRLGVIHAISVSGFHMAVIYGVLERIFGLRGALAASFLYVIFTGLQAATLRAFIMIFFLKLSKYAYKNYDSISSLSMAALILLVIKPYYIGDIGFMLSFLSTLGIILYYNKLLKLCYRLPKKLNETLSISLSAQLFSLPYIAFTLNQFSPGFLIGNFVLLPFYSVLVLLGNVAFLFSFSKVVFNILCGYISIVMEALKGADYLLLKVCPEVTNFSYLYGVALILIYISFIFYKKGYKYTELYPFFVIGFLFVNNFCLFPEIYYTKINGGSATFINYKGECAMVCNYDNSKVIEIYKLKEEMGVTAVISNIQNTTIVNLSGDFKVKVYPAKSLQDFNDIEVYTEGEFYNINSKTVNTYSDLYVIILNRLFHLTGNIYGGKN